MKKRNAYISLSVILAILTNFVLLWCNRDYAEDAIYPEYVFLPEVIAIPELSDVLWNVENVVAKGNKVYFSSVTSYPESSLFYHSSIFSMNVDALI